MVLDEVRTGAYRNAIFQVVKKGDVVVDIGSGSGILALFAAKAGAGKVYAVEKSRAVEFIYAHVKENEFEDIIEIIHADIESLDKSNFKETPNVIISEMLGNFAPCENLHDIYLKAKTLAQPETVTIPLSYKMIFAPANPRIFGNHYSKLKNINGVSLNYMMNRIYSSPFFHWLSIEELVGPEIEGCKIEVCSPQSKSYSSLLQATKDSIVTAISVSFIAELTSNIFLSSSVKNYSQSWPQTIFPLFPSLYCKKGDSIYFEIRPQDVVDKQTWQWIVEHNGVRYFYGVDNN